MKKILFVAFIGLSLLSCNKDQKAINSLDGRWKATSFMQITFDETTDFLEDGSGYELTFDKCKQAKDISVAEEDVYEEVLEKGCGMKIVTILPDGSNTAIEGKYATSENGTVISFVNIDFNKPSIFSITSITSSELKLELNEDGVRNVITLVK